MKLNYKSYGEGKPVIILHGLFGMLDNWHTIAKRLDGDYNMILVDLRNHGKSPKSDNFDYDLMAEDIAELCEDLGLDRVSVIGHSMGGKAAIQLAHDNPTLVYKLIVVDIGIKRYAPGHNEIFDAVLSLDVGRLVQRSHADEHLRMRINDEGIRQFLMKNLSRTKEGGYLWRANFEALYKNYDLILDSPSLVHPIDTDTLFIRGSRSHYILEEDIPSLQEQFTHARFQTIDAGHWVHAERPVLLLSEIREFLGN